MEGVLGHAARLKKAQNKQGESCWLGGLNKGLRNAKKWATLMRAPALPCKQKAGEEGGGKGKLGMENWKICKVSFRKKVI